jgi:16S rRNA (guanine527-N7)-methyltransferase
MKRLEKFLTEESDHNDPDKYIKQFENYNTYLLDWNKKINLVSRSTISIEDHIINSIFFLKKFPLKADGKLADIGTGGGFPGIPLKILYAELTVTLIDSISKKITAVYDIIQNLGLKKIEAITGRAEDISKKSEYKNKFDYVTAKAVARLYELFIWSEELLKPGGKLLFIKGGDINDEVKELQKLNKKISIEVISFLFPEEYKIEDKKLVVISPEY